MRSSANPSTAAGGSAGKQEYLPLDDGNALAGRASDLAYENENLIPRKSASRRKPSLLAWCAICSLAFLYAAGVAAVLFVCSNSLAATTRATRDLSTNLDRAVLFVLNGAVAKTRRGTLGSLGGDGRRMADAELDDIWSRWGQAGSGTEELARYPTDFLRDVVPVPCHSHNDYWRAVPLFSAIRAGCTGVEADVWLHDGQLYVGHDRAALQRNRTFRSLYIDPLVALLERQNPATEFYNGSDHGVFDTSPYQTLALLVDVKTDGDETWPLVHRQLEPLRSRGWLTRVEDGRVRRGPITVVGTGNAPFGQIVANSTYRDSFFDAPLDKLDEQAGGFGSANSYYASASIGDAVGRVSNGRLTPDQLVAVRKQVEAAHGRGLKARYWDLPSWPIHVRNRLWEVLVREGVDILNVDDLAAATAQDWTAATPASSDPER